MRTSSSSSLVLLLALVAGCSSSSKKVKTQAIGPAVPWTSAAAAAGRRAGSGRDAVPGRRPHACRGRSRSCRTSREASRSSRSAIRARVRAGSRDAPASGSSRKAGRRRCRSPSRRPSRTSRRRPTPRRPSLALRPGESGALTITWDNWCDPVIPGKPHVPPSAVRITLPDGRGSLDADYNAVPQCLDPSKPTHDRRLRLPAVRSSRQARPWTTAFLRASIPNQPVQAGAAGSSASASCYERLENDRRASTGAPPTCSSSRRAGRSRSTTSTARPRTRSRPGRALAFAMQLRVPRDAPFGANGLFWELDPFGAAGRRSTRA